MKVWFFILAIFFLTQFIDALEAQPKCPQDGIGSSLGDAPAVLVKTPKGHLLVCGFQEKKDQETWYSEFDIYSETKGKYSASLFRVGALDTYRIKPFKGGLHLIELIHFRGKMVPSQTLAMNCNLGDKCSISRATCETSEITAFETDILERIKPFYKNKKYPDEAMLMELGDLAMTGNAEAIQMFQKNPGFKLDGASAEIFESIKARLNQPCFKNR